MPHGEGHDADGARPRRRTSCNAQPDGLKEKSRPAATPCHALQECRRRA
jgi:hypothetical protein